MATTIDDYKNRFTSPVGVKITSKKKPVKKKPEKKK